MAMTLVFPIAEFHIEGADYQLTACVLSSGTHTVSTMWMGILFVLAIIVPLVAIFLFKRRVLQIRLCAYLDDIRWGMYIS